VSFTFTSSARKCKCSPPAPRESTTASRLHSAASRSKLGPRAQSPATARRFAAPLFATLVVVALYLASRDPALRDQEAQELALGIQNERRAGQRFRDRKQRIVNARLRRDAGDPIAGAHHVAHQRQEPSPEGAAGVRAREVVGPEAAGFEQGDGERVAEGQGRGRARGRSQVQRARLDVDVRVEVDVGEFREHELARPHLHWKPHLRQTYA